MVVAARVSEAPWEKLEFFLCSSRSNALDATDFSTGTCLQHWEISKWTRFLRATARVFLFMDNLKTKERRALFLEDIDKARSHLFQVSQLNSFSGTVKDLINGKESAEERPTVVLITFVKYGILRVGGRTKRSSLPFEAKHLIWYYWTQKRQL